MNIRLFSRRLTLFLISLLILTILLTPSFTTAGSDTSPEVLTKPGTQIIRSDEAILDFQLHTAAFQIDHDGRIQVDGLEHSIVDPGSPPLPYYSTFIALPPQATISVTVKESGLSQHTRQVLPVPHQQLGAEVDGDDILAANPESISELAPVFAEDNTIYALDTPFPKTRFEVSQPLYLRDLRLVELKLFPLRYNPTRKMLTQAADLSVHLAFSGANLNNLNPSPGFVDNQGKAWRDSILNFEQAHAWRSLPPLEPFEQSSQLPIGADTFKILVDEDGIYEITAAELAAQGMALPVDPTTIEMMHGGLPVAFQFIDVNGGGQFDAVDKIRFYGWAFNGSRYEQMYVNDNVFWLWAGGSADPVPVVDNEAGAGSVVTTFVDSVTRQDENDNFSAWAVEWENDPTIWHWDLITAASGVTKTKTYDIELHDPDPNATGNTILVEFTTKLNSFVAALPTYSSKTYLNDFAGYGEAVWNGRKNLNVVNSVPGSGLKQPVDVGYPNNQIKIDLSSDSATTATVYLTRITVEYARILKAFGDQLIFSQEQEGQHDFQVSGFSNGDAASVVVWDISDHYQPQQIRMQAQNILGGGSDHTYVIGRTHAKDARFVATTTSNILPVKGVSHYEPVPIVPPSSSAQWLAITHSSLRDAADTLAVFREADFSTWVVDVEDVTNQVGYGFNTPQTIRDYLFQALTNWSVPPEYVTLFGDATRNPLGQDCPLCGAWDKDAPTLMVTDFAFVDRWNGMVPSDFTMSLLIGNDLLPDVAIGRMPANTLTEANHMVQKVILYETQRPDKLEEWQKNFLFVADNSDAGGNFCAENINTGSIIPPIAYNKIHLCLPAATVEDTNALRTEMGKQVNDNGISVLNYRGHGSPLAWAGGPSILTVNDTDFWQNVGRSVVILSADCLDGYFIHTHLSALGESFHRLNNRGSVAHWSSSGFGFSSEHSVLHSGYYEGMFEYGLNEIGDAVNYSKIQYYQDGYFPSELYSFILLGDPALKVVSKIQIEAGGIYLPAVLTRNNTS